MDYANDFRSNNTHKLIGKVIGVVGIAVCAIIVYPLIGIIFGRNAAFSFSQDEKCYDASIAILPIVYLMTCVFWLYAVEKNKYNFMLVALCLWGFILGFASVHMFFHFHEYQRTFETREIFLFGAIAYWLCNLIAAIAWCGTWKKFNRRYDVGPKR